MYKRCKNGKREKQMVLLEILFNCTPGLWFHVYIIFENWSTFFLEECIKMNLQFHLNKFLGLERNIQKNLYERGSNWYEIMYSFLPAICIISLLITKSGLHEYMHAGRKTEGNPYDIENHRSISYSKIDDFCCWSFQTKLFTEKHNTISMW